MKVDAISREAVLDIVKFEDRWLFDAGSDNCDTDIAFENIISKVSELPPVTPKTDILDKIRAEIEDIAFDWQEIDGEHESFMIVNLDKVLDIIDKYKEDLT